MAIKFLLLVATLLLVVLISVTNLIKANEQPKDDNDPAYWRARRDLFYRATRFNLTEENLRLLGRKRTIFENQSTMPTGHLPFWFDYDLFKKVFNKPKARDEAEELARHHAYTSTCMRTFKARTLFRMLAGTHDTFITSDADKFYWEKFGPFEVEQVAERNNGEDEISVVSKFIFGPADSEEQTSDESPLGRAIRLMRQEMEIVESRNQVETYLKAFREFDGSAIAGKLPY